VLFDIDVKGGLNLKKMYPDIAMSVFIMPPSIEELEHRLIARSTDDIQTIRKRVDKAKLELSFANQFEIVIVNDNLEEAKNKVYKVVSDFISTHQS
jgi:guanylate kinase